MNRNKLTTMIIEYENGDLSEKQKKTLFRYLIKTGMAWKLQGSYGREAQRMIDNGEIKVKRRKR